MGKVTVSSISATSLKVSWEAGKRAKGWKIKYRESAPIQAGPWTWTEKHHESSGKKKSDNFTITGLTPGTKYKVKVRRENATFFVGEDSGATKAPVASSGGGDWGFESGSLSGDLLSYAYDSPRTHKGWPKDKNFAWGAPNGLFEIVDSNYIDEYAGPDCVNHGNFALRIGPNVNGAGPGVDNHKSVARVRFGFVPTAANPNFRFSYQAVLGDGDHPGNASAFMRWEIRSAKNKLFSKKALKPEIDGHYRVSDVKDQVNSWQSLSNGVFFRPWQSMCIRMNKKSFGQLHYFTLDVGGCTVGAHPGYVFLDSVEGLAGEALGNVSSVVAPNAITPQQPPFQFTRLNTPAGQLAFDVGYWKFEIRDRWGKIVHEDFERNKNGFKNQTFPDWHPCTGAGRNGTQAPILPQGTYVWKLWLGNCETHDLETKGAQGTPSGFRMGTLTVLP